jgi:hypothetical protein
VEAYGERRGETRGETSSRRRAFFPSSRTDPHQPYLSPRPLLLLSYRIIIILSQPQDRPPLHFHHPPRSRLSRSHPWSCPLSSDGHVLPRLSFRRPRLFPHLEVSSSSGARRKAERSVNGLAGRRRRLRAVERRRCREGKSCREEHALEPEASRSQEGRADEDRVRHC